MPHPIALCLEDLDVPGESNRYLQCVAVAGTDPGLSLDLAGDVLWQANLEAVACELWVSQDDRLILFRRRSRPGQIVDTILLERGGRQMELPVEKPVVLVDQDLVQIGRRRLRLHVHGDAPAVHAPTPFVPDPPEQAILSASGTSRAAAALVLGAAVGVSGCPKMTAEPPSKVEIRDRPPKVAPHHPDASAPKPDLQPTAATPDQRVKPVEVRVRPPRMVRPPDPTPAPPPKKAK